SFGDGTPDMTGTGTLPAPITTHTYQSPATYDAQLTISGASQQATRRMEVRVTPAAPHADLTAVGASKESGIHKIKHVIIIMQENRSFDSYFGTFPGADGIPMSNGKPSVCLPDPRAGHCVRPFHDPHDVNVGGPHGSPAFGPDYNNGKMNGF